MNKAYQLTRQPLRTNGLEPSHLWAGSSLNDAIEYTLKRTGTNSMHHKYCINAFTYETPNFTTVDLRNNKSRECIVEITMEHRTCELVCINDLNALTNEQVDKLYLNLN